MTAELEHAEQVMYEHEKENFAVVPDKQKHRRQPAKESDGEEKYSSLYSSFDVMKPNEDLPPFLHKVQYMSTSLT